MARQITPKAVFITVGPAAGTSHDGNPFHNEDFPRGTYFCQDVDGEWYVNRIQAHFDVAVPFPTKLFREHWSILPEDFETTTAPYYASLRNAPRHQCEIKNLEDE